MIHETTPSITDKRFELVRVIRGSDLFLARNFH